MALDAGNNINLAATTLSNQSENGLTQLKAGHDLNLETVQTNSHKEIHFDENNHIIRGSSSEIGTNIQTNGNVTLMAAHDVNARAANVSSQMVH